MQLFFSIIFGGDIMSKLMIIPSETNLKDYECADAFLFGLDKLSINFPIEVTIEELKKIINQNKNKEIFVSLNKNMHNNDLEILKKALKELSKLKIKGIFFYDTAVYQLNIYNLNLVWAQEHFLTNYQTANYWYKLGVNYGLVSSEITKEEINEIIKKSKMELIVPVFGYQSLFVSERHIINNYLNQFKLKKSTEYFLEKENKEYSIVDKDLTVAYSPYILNGLEENFKSSYLLLNTYNIEKQDFLQVLQGYKEKNNDFEKLFNNLDKGFFYKKTVYKVK